MITPLVCLFLALLLPYVWTYFIAQARKQDLGEFDNKNPRLQQARLTGKGARALGAHQNAFEALLVFAPTIIVAMWVSSRVPEQQEWISRLAVAWVVARIGHGAAYVADQDKLRSIFFGIAQLAVVSLWVIIFRAVA